MRRPASAWCLVLVAVLVGCQSKVDVAVQLHEDGSGVVRVGVGLDADALARTPQLVDQARTEDLRQAGWTIDGPAVEADGFTWWRASKAFADPDDAVAVLAEAGGIGGPLSGLGLRVDRAFARTTYRAEGNVDFSGGLERFGDGELSALLDGEPLGVDQTVLEQQFGAPVDQLVDIRVSVELPGEQPVVIEPSLAGPAVPVTATVTRWRRASLIASAVAGSALLLALLWIVLHLLRRRSRSRAQARHLA